MDYYFESEQQLDFIISGNSAAKNVSICYTLSFVINLIMNWLLIPRIGAIGAAIGTVISLSPFPVLLAIQSKREWVKHE